MQVFFIMARTILFLRQDVIIQNLEYWKINASGIIIFDLNIFFNEHCEKYSSRRQ